MKAEAVLETVLYASDLVDAEAFYRDVLGLEVYSRVAGRQVFLRCGRQMVLIFNPSVTGRAHDHDARLPVPPHGAIGPGHVCFAASATEFGAWRRRLEGHGIAIEAEFEWPNPDPDKRGRSIYFRDPAGNSLEFAEPRIWGITTAN